MTPELLDTVAELPKVMPHIEVPVQAGDDKVLADMQAKNGVKVNKVDTAPFVAKLATLQDEVAKELGTTEVLARIRALK